MSTIKAIAQALEERRMAMGMTKRELATRAGVSRPTLDHLLTEHRDTKLGTVLAVATALSLDLAVVQPSIARALTGPLGAPGTAIGPATPGPISAVKARRLRLLASGAAQ